MTIDELSELLLAAMYEETEKLGHTNYFLLVNEIATDLGIEDHSRLIDACRILEDKGYILLAFDHVSSLSAFITQMGETFVRQGGETGIIGEYQRYRSQLAGTEPGATDAISEQETPPASPLFPDTAQPPVGNEGIQHIIASMDMLIQNDPSLSETAKIDLAADIRTLNLQMSKASVNMPLIDMISGQLRKVPSLIPLVDLLMTMHQGTGTGE